MILQKLKADAEAYLGQTVTDAVTLPLETYRTYSELFEEDLYGEIGLETCVAKRISEGGTSVESVKSQITYVRAQLA